MNDTESARTGYTKLYHPRGPLVSLPVVGDTPAAMFAYVTACLDAGFVVAAPGLEVGEEREMINGILRGDFEHDGEVTPILLLYAANEAMKFSVLKVYLNNDEDVRAFESACGFKLDALPVYEGKDKPERDGGKLATKFIFKLPKPVPVIFKQNPKYSEEEAATAKAANKPYIKPRRLFLRWADAATAEVPHAPPLTDMQVAESAWKMRLSTVQVLDDMNKILPMVKAIVDEHIRKRAWTMCLDFADGKKWVFDPAAKVFKDAAEVATTTPPTTPSPPPPAQTAPPPPDDLPAVPPLIAAWQKRLGPDTINLMNIGGTLNLTKMNGEILTHFKSIGKAEPERGNVWVMIVEFAQKHGCEFDTGTMKFVETVPSMP